MTLGTMLIVVPIVGFILIISLMVGIFQLVGRKVRNKYVAAAIVVPVAVLPTALLLMMRGF